MSTLVELTGNEDNELDGILNGMMRPASAQDDTELFNMAVDRELAISCMEIEAAKQSDTVLMYKLVADCRKILELECTSAYAKTVIHTLGLMSQIKSGMMKMGDFGRQDEYEKMDNAVTRCNKRMVRYMDVSQTYLKSPELSSNLLRMFLENFYAIVRIEQQAIAMHRQLSAMWPPNALPANADYEVAECASKSKEFIEHITDYVNFVSPFGKMTRADMIERLKCNQAIIAYRLYTDSIRIRLSLMDDSPLKSSVTVQFDGMTANIKQKYDALNYVETMECVAKARMMYASLPAPSRR